MPFSSYFLVRFTYHLNVAVHGSTDDHNFLWRIAMSEELVFSSMASVVAAGHGFFILIMMPPPVFGLTFGVLIALPSWLVSRVDDSWLFDVICDTNFESVFCIFAFVLSGKLTVRSVTCKTFFLVTSRTGEVLDFPDDLGQDCKRTRNGRFVYHSFHSTSMQVFVQVGCVMIFRDCA